MMTMKIRIIIAVGLIVALIFVIRIIVKKKLDVKYALPWMFMIASLGILDLFPGLIKIISEFMGINSPANMMFFLGFCFSLIIIFKLTMKIYNISNRLRRVAQQMALLQEQVEKKK